jgi:UDPglucose--hexose-1-phosphate uridylyltransferase
VIHTSPFADENKEYYLWHMQIIPRLTKAAGFELGSGIYISTAVPEETAAFMMGIKMRPEDTDSKR